MKLKILLILINLLRLNNLYNISPSINETFQMDLYQEF